MNKEATYKQLLENITSLIEGEDDIITVMSTISCEVFHSFEYLNWVGFYRLVNSKTLKVGPYQGGHGCLTIDINKGVCGKCVRENRVQLENDVQKLPFHIACSSETKAEIVLPVTDDKGRLFAVFDLDSIEKDVFDEVDQAFLKRICRLVGATSTSA